MWLGLVVGLMGLNLMNFEAATSFKFGFEEALPFIRLKSQIFFLSLCARLRTYLNCSMNALAFALFILSFWNLGIIFFFSVDYSFLENAMLVALEG